MPASGVALCFAPLRWVSVKLVSDILISVPILVAHKRLTVTCGAASSKCEATVAACPVDKQTASYVPVLWGGRGSPISRVEHAQTRMFIRHHICSLRFVLL